MITLSANHPAPQSMQFPTVTTENLLGERATFPEELPGDPTLVLVAFTQAQQHDIDAWVEALDLKTAPPVEWIELPTVGRVYRPMKRMVDGWMRAGIPSEDGRRRTYTVFTNVGAFHRSLGVNDAAQVLVVLTHRTGEVCSIVRGAPNPQAIETVRRNLPTSEDQSCLEPNEE